MNAYMKSGFIGILLASMILPAHGQRKGYFPGYIITPEGETLEGLVKDRSQGNILKLYRQVRFKPGNAALKRKYSPVEILGYGRGEDYFESVPLAEESAFFRSRYSLRESNKRIFLKVIAYSGDLSYFHWEYVDGDSNYLDYIPLFYREGYTEMVRVTQGILGLKRKRLAEYFRDCPGLVQAIEKKELNEIDEVYNFYMDRCDR